MTPRTITLFLHLVLALSAPVHAEKADKDKPVAIEADDCRVDDLKGTSECEGSVIVAKGTLQLRADKVFTRKDPDGYDYAVATNGPGRRAFFRQKRDGVDEFVEAEADVIDYDGKKDVVKLIRNAEIRTLRGATLANEYRADLVTYDSLNSTYSFVGQAESKGDTKRRVKLLMTPAPSTSGATPAPTAGLAPALRISPTPSVNAK